jgi:hypothetical protein
MKRTQVLKAFLVILATSAVAAGQAFTPRTLSPGSAVCVNPPLNLTGRKIEIDSTRELVRRILEAGFASGPLGTLETCHATLFTEVVSMGGRDRKSAELEFRIVLLGEQIPRLVSSAQGKSVNRDGAVLAAIADEVRQIRGAQPKGMRIYAGALE